jgi:hypothetical protein
MKQTLKQADYFYIKYLGNSLHLLRDNSTSNLEIFFPNKNHASWGIKWKNTHLEFMRSLNSKTSKRPQNPANGRPRSLLQNGNSTFNNN